MIAHCLAWVLLGASVDAIAAQEPAAEEQPDLTRARQLFQEGSVRYEAADYGAAIEVFTKAIRELDSQGVSDVYIRGVLLYNIAKSHARAYDIDRDVIHLRQASVLYRRFIDRATSGPGEGLFDQNDVKDAREELTKVEAQLEAIDKPKEEPEPEAQPEPEPKPEPEPEPAPPPKPSDEWKKPRGTGIGLLVTGIVSLGAGGGLIGYGTQFKPNAEAEVAKLDDLGLPDDHPAFEDGEEFIADETRKGQTMIGVGAGAAAVGAAMVGLGAYYLVKSKKMKAGGMQAAAVITPNFSGLTIFGRF